MQVARYQTERGAQRYADELTASERGRDVFTFKVASHPYDFAWTVIALKYGGYHATVGKRPRGGPRKGWAVDSDGFVHA